MLQLWAVGLICHQSWCQATHMAGCPMANSPWACTHRTSLYLQVWASNIYHTHSARTFWLKQQHLKNLLRLWRTFCFSVGGPGLEPPYRPARNPQMNKMMNPRSSYPGMMPGMQGNMPGMMGMDKQYQMGYKAQPSMPQGQMLRQQLQVRLVSQSTLTCRANFSQV